MKFTKEECNMWFKNKLKNPKTKRKIKANGSTYKKIEKKCSKFNTTIKKRRFSKRLKSRKITMQLNKVETDINNLNADLNSSMKKLSTDDLGRVIEYANDKYYNTNQSIFSDAIYDILVDELKRRNPKHKVLGNIGAPIKSGEKVKLPYWMGSMDKIKPDTNELKKWSLKYSGPYVISEKLDGVSALLVHNNNQNKLYTRGNGEFGQDISQLLKYINIPNLTKNISVRGELIISKNNFKKINKEFANARNCVSGIVNSKDLKKRKNVANLVDFITYEVLDPILKPDEQMKTLKKLNFNTVNNSILNKLSGDKLSELLIDARKNSPHEIDGIIVTNNEIYPRKISGNPKHSFAFKMVLSDQMAEVKVIDVEWSPSKHSLLKPRVIIEPVKIGGVTIKCATGYNAKFINDNKIGPGAIVKLIRSGDVIPKIIEVINPTKPKFPNIEYKWNDTKVDIILSSSKKNDIVEIKKLLNFMKKVGVKYVSEGLCKRFYDYGLNSIYLLKNASVEDFLKIDGIKDKLANKIFNEIQNAMKNIRLEKLMAASNIFGQGFGERRCKLVLDFYPNILDMHSVLSTKELINKICLIEGYQERTAKKFVLALPKFKEFLKNLDLNKKFNKLASQSQSQVVKKVTTQKLTLNNIELKKVVLTGFRGQVVDFLNQNNVETSSSISKNVDLVIAKDINSTSSKIVKAKKLQIPIISLNKFKTHFKL